jgi:hypothetical protein
MKKQVVNVLTKIGLLSVITLGFSFAPALGQNLAYKVRANVPFDFTVADKQLPAGRYSIGRVEQGFDSNILSITGLDNSSNIVRSSLPIQGRETTNVGRLVFHRYGNRYFLAELWLSGSSTGRKLFKSRSEREVERNLAANTAAQKSAKNEMFETVNIVGGLQ